MKPFRILAAILMLMIAAEIYGILNTPTYEAELQEARTAYQEALAENTALKKQRVQGAAAGEQMEVFWIQSIDRGYFTTDKE